MSDSLPDPTDVRDERIAALLETEPLDELTRARLVRAAMDASTPASTPASESPWARRSGWIGVAAAIVLLGVVLVGVLGRQQTSERFNDAGARLAPSPTASDAWLVAPQAGPTDVATAFAFGTLGDLGDVGTAARLRAAVTAVLPAAEAKAAEQSTALPLDALSERRVEGQVGDCPAGTHRPSGRSLGFGTGTVDGQPVVVAVVEKSDGIRVAYVLDAAGCTTGERVKL